MRIEIRILLLVVTIGVVLVTASSVFGNESAKTGEALKSHVKYLSSDELEGRGTGTDGNRLAAKYIADYFSENDVEPFHDSYFQEFEVITAIDVNENTRAGYSNSSGRVNWTLDEDFRPLGFSANETVNASVVFVGYGISATDEGYDDYADVDVTDKVVVVFSASPDYSNPHGKFAGYASLNYKVQNAAEQGAAGIVYVNPLDYGEGLEPIRVRQAGRGTGIPAIHITRDVAQQMFSDQSLDSLESRIKRHGKPHSFDIAGVKLEMDVSLDHVQTTTANVVGWVEGTDATLKDEYILIGAHFDHLGHGGPGSRHTSSERIIHNGADDNASGTAIVMEMGRRFAADPAERSIIFVAFTAEEMGLLGSAHYATESQSVIDQMAMMINLDMVGRVDSRKFQLTGTGSSPGFEDLLDSLATIHEAVISKTADGFGPSDHASFYSREVPVINFFSGLHDDYHRPSDTWEKLNYDGMVLVADFAEDLMESVAAYPEKPEFVKVKATRRSGQMRFRVTLGIIPDYADSERGMKITGVHPGRAASNAGLMDGDILIKFGEVAIKDVYDYTYALSKFKPGDETTVVVVRGEKEDELEFTVTLDGRR